MDVLDRPDLGGGWEEIWRSLEMVEFFDLDVVIEYTLLLENATTAAKVGFFLEQHKEALMVEASHLDPLRARRPLKPHYLMRGHARGAARFRVEPGGAAGGARALLAGGGVKISSERLRREAEATGFRPEVLEKVIHLLNLLEALRSHPFLKDRLVPGAGVELHCLSIS